MTEQIYIILLISIFCGALFLAHRYTIKTYVAVLVVTYVPEILELLYTWLKLKYYANRLKKQIDQFRFTGVYNKFIKVFIKFDEQKETLLNTFLTKLGGKDMPLRAQPVGKKIEYVPESQKDEDDPTIILMEKKPRREIVRLKDNLVSLSDQGQVDRLRSATVNYEVTLVQFSGWRNMLDETGERQLEFDEENVKGMYDLLPVQVQEELEREFGGGIVAREETEEDSETESVDEDSDEEDDKPLSVG